MVCIGIFTKFATLNFQEILEVVIKASITIRSLDDDLKTHLPVRIAKHHQTIVEARSILSETVCC